MRGETPAVTRGGTIDPAVTMIAPGDAGTMLHVAMTEAEAGMTEEETTTGVAGTTVVEAAKKTSTLHQGAAPWPTPGLFENETRQRNPHPLQLNDCSTDKGREDDLWKKTSRNDDHRSLHPLPPPPLPPPHPDVSPFLCRSRHEKDKLERDQARRRSDQAREVATMRANAMRAGGAAPSKSAPSSKSKKAEDSSSVSSDSEDERDPCRVSLKKLKEKLSASSAPASKAMVVGRHWSDKTREEMDERDWRIFREDHQIATKGGKVPLPMRGWRDADPTRQLPDDLLEVIDRVGYKKPSPIQMQCIPIGIGNRDCVGLAETGSGKTVAYLFPMLVYIKSLPPLNEETKQLGPMGLVLAPTRELVQQIEDECDKFMRDMKLNVYSIVGGVSIEEQSFIAQKGVEVIIATPGRLKDCLERSYIVLAQCNYIVLDEADRMIDLNFETDLLFILDSMQADALKPEDESQELIEGKVYRQTFMFSATMPPAVERISRKYMRRNVVVTIGEVGMAVDRIKQTVEVIKENAKQSRLMDIINNEFVPPYIIFMARKNSCDRLGKHLELEGWNCAILHGGRSQDARESAIVDFKAGRKDILIASDVAARGLDVKGVTLVVNYDVPKNIDEYTHRIGRTGRAGMTGDAVTFLTAEDEHIMFDLKKMLEKCKQVVPHELGQFEAAKFKDAAGKGKGKGDRTQHINMEDGKGKGKGGKGKGGGKGFGK